MVKSRGCSCWPFFRSSNQKQRKNQRQSLDTNEDTQVRDVNARESFNNNSSGNNNNSNFVRVQRGIQSLDQVQISNQNVIRARTQEINRINMNQFQRLQHNENERQDTEEIRQRNKVRIKTKVSKRDVKYVNEYPTDADNQKIFKYCCPICLRYFNNILTSTCCKNYICRLCIGDMARKAKNNRNFVIKCTHCCEDDFKLEDVKHESTVKYYTDTPFKMAKTKEGSKDDENLSDKDDEKSTKNNIPQDNSISKEKQLASNHKSMDIGSPVPRINLTDLTQLDSQMINMQQMPESAQQHLRNVLIGDTEHPDYESPYPIKHLNKQLMHQNINCQQNNHQNLTSLIKHDIEDDEENFYSQKNQRIVNDEDSNQDSNKQERYYQYKSHFLPDEEEKEVAQGIVIEDGSLEDKMRLLQQVDSHKSLISGRIYSENINTQNILASTDSKYLLEQELNFQKMLEELQKSERLSINQNIQQSSRHMMSQNESPMSYNLRTSIAKNQKFEQKDIASILNGFDNINNKKKVSGVFNDTQPLKLRVDCISFSQCEKTERAFQARNNKQGAFKTSFRHTHYNNDFDKENLNPNISPGLKKATDIKSSDGKRLPLHEMYQKYQQISCLTDKKLDEFPLNNQQSVNHYYNRASSGQRRSFALQQVSQEILSPLNSRVAKFQVNESQIKLRRESFYRQDSSVNKNNSVLLSNTQAINVLNEFEV